MEKLGLGESPVSSRGRAECSPIVNQSRRFLSSTEVTLEAETHLGCPIWSIGVSKSGILCGCDDGSIVLLNSNLDCCFRLQQAHGSSPVVSVSWAEDGVHFLTVGTDLTVKVWSIETTEERTATCLYTLLQISPVITASFHPRTFPAVSSLILDPTKKSLTGCTVFVLTADRRISIWTDGQIERYESLSSKDSSPVCMSTRLVEAVPWIAVGTKTGELLVYSFVWDKGLVFEQSISCRNRRGKFKDGTPIVSIFWVTARDLLVASQDDRLRLVRLGSKGNSPSVIAKFKGHESSKGEVPLPAFVVSPPFGDKVVQSGSECGRIFIWSLKRTLLPTPKKSGFSLLSKVSSASRPLDSWTAVTSSDKLTAVAPAPWVPEKGQLGTSCTVTGSLDGVVKLFLCRYDA